MWQMAGLGPMAGQAGHFHIYAIERYDREMQRLLNVMDTRLGKSEYLADQYSIADIACWPVINTFQRLPPITPFANIVRWHDLIGERPAARETLSESGI